MKTRIFALISSSLAVVAAVACSSSSSNGGSNDPCTAYANAIVGQALKCDGTLDPSQSSAVGSRYAKLCQSQISLPGAPTNVGSQLTACASAIAAADCNTDTNQLDACNIDFNGTLADGTTCGASLQCSSGDCQITSGGGDGGTVSNCGKCTPAIADGGDCSSGGNCVKGDTCKFTTATDGSFSGTCVVTPAPAALGATCDSATNCKTPNHCAFGSGDTGTCTAPVASGGTCQSNSECASGLVCAGDFGSQTCTTPVAIGGACTGGDCAVGAACDSTSKKCAKITFGASGATCDGTVSLCSKGSCYIPSGDGGTSATTGTCPTIIPDDGACDSSQGGSSCDEFASCTNGKCVFIPAACK